MTLHNCTISGNRTETGGQGGNGGHGGSGGYGTGYAGSANAGGAGGSGGGICSVLRSELFGCTIVYNSAAAGGPGGTWPANVVGSQGGQGGGVASVGTAPPVALANTIVALNKVSAWPLYSDVQGNFLSRGCNLLGKLDGSTGFSSGLGDLLNALPLVGPLADHGGGTRTHALWQESPAVNAGSNFWAEAATDQRGGARIVCNTVDIGAVEYNGCPVVLHPIAQRALYFDGIDDYVQTPNLRSQFTNETVTLELWFKALGPGVLVDERDTSGAWRDSQLEIVGTTNALRGEVRVRVWTVAGSSLPVTVGTVDYGTWNHAALRYDKATLKLDGFLNGLKSTNGIAAVDRLAPFEYNGSYGLVYFLGLQEDNHLGSGAWFNGFMDEFRVWNAARTDAEIWNDYDRRLTGSEANLALYYGFNEGSGTTVVNSALTGGVLNGTLVNGPGYVTSGARLFQPLVTTLAAQTISATTATLQGHIVTYPGSGDTPAWFEYGTTLNFGRDNANNPINIAAGVPPQIISLAVTNLESGTRYYFRLVALNGGRMIYGKPLPFDTLVVGNGYPITTRSDVGQSTTAPRHITDPEGNIYLAGLFSGSAQFKEKLTAAGSLTNAFLAMLSRKGDWRWAVNIPVTNGQAQIKALTLENRTNVLVAGSFSGTATFGTNRLTAAANQTRGFIARFEPAGSLEPNATNWTWSTAIGEGITNSANAPGGGQRRRDLCRRPVQRRHPLWHQHADRGGWIGHFCRTVQCRRSAAVGEIFWRDQPRCCHRPRPGCVQ